jgi:antitoxin (DNA-binding transcriptional repressor) of toxin-antitoxin stability system
MAVQTRGGTMPITPTDLRSNIFRVLDRVLETGEPVEVLRRGRILRIIPDTQKANLDSLPERKGYLLVDPDEIIHLDWSNEWNP